MILQQFINELYNRYNVYNSNTNYENIDGVMAQKLEDLGK